MRVVIDTNVLVAAFRSRHGASYCVLQLLGRGFFQPIVSTTLCVEYEAVLRRPGILPSLSSMEVDELLGYFLAHCEACAVYFLWRPFLPDENDGLVLEAALAGRATVVVTHNTNDFAGVESLGIQVMTPAQFLSILRAS